MLVIGISSRALFDLGQSHSVYESKGLQAYSEYQIEREDNFLKPGVAFPLVRKLLALNEDEVDHPGVEVILLSRNSADTGLRIFNSIEHFGLNIERAAFTGGDSPYRYMKAYGADLLLSTNAGDVRKALEKGYAAATILPGSASSPDSGQLRIAFDGDAVIFGDEAERVFQEQGLEAFSDNERQSAGQPLSGGPFKPVLEALHKIQSAYPIDDNPIRNVPLLFQEFLYKFKGCALVPARLGQDLQNLTFIVNCAPQIRPLATNSNKDLIKMPGSRRLNSARSDVGSNRRA